MDYTAAGVNTAIKIARDVENVIALNAIRCRRVYNSLSNHVRAFLAWRTPTGSSNISPSTTLSRPCKELILQLPCIINQWYVYQQCARTGYASNWSLIKQTGSSFI